VSRERLVRLPRVPAVWHRSVGLAQGNPRVSYYDDLHHILKFAQWGKH